LADGALGRHGVEVDLDLLRRACIQEPGEQALGSHIVVHHLLEEVARLEGQNPVQATSWVHDTVFH
jgi:hypothetical protein